LKNDIFLCQNENAHLRSQLGKGRQRPILEKAEIGPLKTAVIKVAVQTINGVNGI